MHSPILGQSYVARSVNAADNRLVNLFPEATPAESKTRGFFSRCPGLRLLVTVGTGPIRGMWRTGSYLYVVSGTELYKVTSAWVATLLGTVAGTGQVSMSDNGTQIFIATNPLGYIYNTSTGVFQQITNVNFTGAVNVGYLDGYFVFNEPNTQKVWVTSLLDGLTVDPLDFASAEGAPDLLTALICDHREVWLFGTNSVEVWYNAGLADFPLTRIQGAFNEIGCAAPYSVAKLDNSIFWLGSDARGTGIVYKAQGYTGVRLSTHAIEYAIQGYGDISDAVGYTYQQEGHSFYVLSFPTADKTWVFDVSTGAWHERAGFSAGAFTRHRGNCQASFGNETVIGDYANGNLYAYDLDVYADNGSTQKWLRSWRALPQDQNNLKRTVQHSLQLDAETGVGLPGFSLSDTTDRWLLTELGLDLLTEGGLTIDSSLTFVQGADPEVSLRWSDDGGHTWSNYHTRSLGRLGVHGTRAIWRRLGMTTKLRDRVYEVSGTDPVKIAITGAELILGATNS
jgi:hypothetical protein